MTTNTAPDVTAIKLAAQAISFGLAETEVAITFMGMGMSAENAFLATVAGRLFTDHINTDVKDYPITEESEET